MKKLNALVSAISLGLTLSFAALPVASAHSTLNIGNSHTAHAHQKHTSKDNGKPYGETYHHHRANPCEKATIWPIPGTGSSGSAQVSATTAPGTAVASFVAPSNCANTFEAAVSWTPAATDLSNFATQLTCQWFEDGTAVGPQFVDNAPVESAFFVPPFQTTPTIFPTDVYAAPKPTAYGYGYGRSSLDTFTLNCFQTVFGNPGASTVQVTGNDTAGLAGQQVYQPVYSNQYAGYPGYSARHHVKVKH